MIPVDVIGWLSATDGKTFLAMFLFVAIVEVPRFMISSAYLSVRELSSCKRQYPSMSEHGGVVGPFSISMLLPGHNEGDALERAVTSLREQTLRPAQIVVIDDGSTDDMAAIGRRLEAQGLIDVFVSTGLRGGKAAAHNLGLEYCTGDIVIIADIDTSLDRDALERMVEPFADARVGGVSGNLGVRNARSTLITRFQAIQYLNSISLGRRVNDMLYGLFVASGAFSAFRRTALNSVGGWAAGPGEDGDVTTRLRRAGWAVQFQPDAWAMTDVPATLTAILRQRARWNRSFTMLRLRKHAGILNPFQSNFSARNAVGTLDAIYFELFRPMMFLLFLCGYVYTYGAAAWPFLAFVTGLYMIAGTSLFLMACALAGEYGEVGLLPYVPGALLFNALVLRPAAIYAYVTELLFRKGYRDTFVPDRILKRVEQY